MVQHLKQHKGGFTLIEILIVIGIIAVLATIVLVAVNPARQFAQANNAHRASDINALLNAVGQYIVDSKGVIPSQITTTSQDISNGGADICALLMPTYIPSLPQDPRSNDGVGITSCTTYNSNYAIKKDSDGRITVSAPDAELSATISVTR
jgi:prepilin-type N-terminal cleavage/methylation domain-containing protein